MAATDAAAPGAATGRYCTPTGFRRLRGAPGWAEADPKVLDQALGRRIWDAAVTLTSADPAGVREPREREVRA